MISISILLVKAGFALATLRSITGKTVITEDALPKMTYPRCLATNPSLKSLLLPQRCIFLLGVIVIRGLGPTTSLAPFPAASPQLWLLIHGSILGSLLNSLLTLQTLPFLLHSCSISCWLYNDL